MTRHDPPLRSAPYDPGLVDAIATGRPIGPEGRTRIIEWYEAAIRDAENSHSNIGDAQMLDVERLTRAYHGSNCPRRSLAFHSCPHRDAHRKSMTNLAAAYRGAR